MSYEETESSNIKADNLLTPKQDNSWMENIPMRERCQHGFDKCAICESAEWAIKIRKDRNDQMTSGANFINDPRAWRISKSGFSIRTGWAGDKRILGEYSGPRSPMDNEAFRLWFETAEKICELYNLTLHPITQATASASALSTTVPDHSPASLPESPSSSPSTGTEVQIEASCGERKLTYRCGHGDGDTPCPRGCHVNASTGAAAAAREIEITFPQLPNYSAEKIIAIIDRHCSGAPVAPDPEAEQRVAAIRERAAALEPCTCICHELIAHCPRCSGETCRPAVDAASVGEPWIRRLAQRIRHHQMKGYNMYAEDQLVAAITEEYDVRAAAAQPATVQLHCCACGKGFDLNSLLAEHFETEHAPATGEEAGREDELREVQEGEHRDFIKEAVDDYFAKCEVSFFAGTKDREIHQWLVDRMRTAFAAAPPVPAVAEGEGKE